MLPPRRAVQRRRRCTVAALAVALLIAIVSGGAPDTATAVSPAPSGLPRLRLRTVADLPGLVALAVRPDDPTLYVASQDGLVRAVRRGSGFDDLVLDISADTRAVGEQGLLGLVFSPDGSKVYVHYTNRQGDTRLDEFAMDGDVADPGSRRTILRVDQPQSNHNGGQLAFGPDGMLYLGLGDGGSRDDLGAGHLPGGNGQSVATLLGKILRLDPTPSATGPYTVPPDNPFVAEPDARPEIWAFGLRNPFRFSFDRETGDLWIGDVGQNRIEEVDFAPADRTGRNAGKGLNFGWNRLEGTAAHRGRAPDDAVAPVAEHAHEDDWFSVIGGYVYHGTIEPLRGTYVYADYYKGELVGLRRAGDAFTPVDLGVSSDAIAAFGEGNDGSLYVLSQTQGLQKLVRR